MNRRPLVSEATALPTEPQPLPLVCFVHDKICRTYSMLFLVHGELLLLDGLELIPEVELGRLLLQLGKLVLVLGHLLQGRLDAETIVDKLVH